MKRWPFLLTLIVLLVGFNFYLIEKKNSKIDRIHYVHKWDTVKKTNLSQSFSTKGVIIPSEKHFVYMDKDAGFNQYLVKEGDTVEAGTPLFDYSPADLEKQKALLDSEIERLQKEINSIDSYIQTLTAMQSSFKADDIEDESKKETEASTISNLFVSLEVEINSKELEKEKLEQQIEQYESQKFNDDGEVASLTIVSGYSGIVTKISHSLQNPVITIASTTPVIEGRLTEEQHTKVKDGMKTIITSDLFKGEVSGVIESVSISPKENAKVDKKSFYPITITLDDHNQLLHEGYHVNTKVITKEVAGATTVKKNSIEQQKKKHWLWVLNKKGIVEKQPIKPGLLVNEKQEVKSGVQAGILYVTNPSNIQQTGYFITPIQISDINKKTLKKVGAKSALKYVLIGVLQK